MAKTNKQTNLHVGISSGQGLNLLSTTFSSIMAYFNVTSCTFNDASVAILNP